MSAARLGKVPMMRRMRTVSSVGSKLTIATGVSASTQTSADCTPSPIATARASARPEMRQKPPGMMFHPSGVRAA